MQASLALSQCTTQVAVLRDTQIVVLGDKFIMNLE